MKFAVPGIAGVPVMAPVEGFKVSPAGIDPVITVHVYGVMPPVAETVRA